MIGRLSATAKPRAFPVVGWRGAQYWDALRASHRVVPSTAPHDADLLLCLGALPQLWHSDLHRLYETVALPRLPVVMSPSFAGAGAKLPGAVHLRPDQLDEDRRWSEIRVAQFDLSRANNRQSLSDREANRGLARQHPALAIAMVIALLSLTGIPPLAGFVGKFMLFTATFEAGLVWLAVLALMNSALSLFYYLRVLAPMLLGEPASGPGVERWSAAVAYLCTAASVGAGLAAFLII